MKIRLNVKRKKKEYNIQYIVSINVNIHKKIHKNRKYNSVNQKNTKGNKIF